MRSYHSHLESLLSESKPSIPRKPTHRASAIFPVFQCEGCTSRITFMGYWKAKREIGPLACVVTLRSEKGVLIARTQQTITKIKSYCIELGDLLDSVGLPRDLEFWGSAEIEIFSSENLVFPFPAVVVNYYGPHFSSVVHTAQRVYNDFDDMRENSVALVPESGFNFYANDDIEPFITLINGPESVANSVLEMKIFNHQNEKLDLEIPLGELSPYQTSFIYPARHTPLADFLEGKPGCAKIRFQVNWIFPRLVLGNHVKSLSSYCITHSYYDCTDARSSGDYWHKSVEQWHPAALMVPLETDKGHFTNAYFYPILSPTDLFVDVEIFDAQGQCLGRKDNALHLTSPGEAFHRLTFKPILQELNIKKTGPLAARIIARPVPPARLPTRIKLGLDVGVEGSGLPCNICTNLYPFNPSLERKPHCFRWAPVMADGNKYSVWLINSSPKKEYQRSARVQVVFYREQDTATICRQYTVPPNGYVKIDSETDPDIPPFFDQRVGWFTATSDNPYLTTYYFVESGDGIVGGDHGF